MKKHLSIFLIFLGIIFISIPFIKNKLVKHYSNIAITESKKLKDVQINLENDSMDNYDFSSIKDLDIETIIKGSKDFDKTNAIGLITIPDLNITLPIMRGITDSNLIAGAVTMKPNQIMGKKNFALAGHNMNNKDLLFGNLMNITIGTKVYLSNNEKIFEYEINDIQIVSDKSVYMIEDTVSEKIESPIVSLMTCYYSSKTGKRFFAIGKLTDEYLIK